MLKIQAWSPSDTTEGTACSMSTFLILNSCSAMQQGHNISLQNATSRRMPLHLNHSVRLYALTRVLSVTQPDEVWLLHNPRMCWSLWSGNQQASIAVAVVENHVTFKRTVPKMTQKRANFRWWWGALVLWIRPEVHNYKGWYSQRNTAMYIQVNWRALHALELVSTAAQLL